MAVEDDFNWHYLLFLLISAILSIFFLFYFNRIFGSLVSYIIRTYAWRRYNVYIDIQALQFSLLGGRCFFKGFRYHGHNETVLINDGHITWRYWLRRVRDVGYLSAAKASRQQGGEEEGQDSGTQPAKNRPASNLPCRVKFKARGVEWFIYNRTAAYEAIEKGLSGDGGLHSRTSTAPKEGSESNRSGFGAEKNGTCLDPSNGGSSSPLAAGEKWAEKTTGGDGSTHESFAASVASLATTGAPRTSEESQSLPAYLMVLPLKIECQKAAVVMGNRDTRSVLTAKFDQVNGHVNAQQARNVDLYKQMFEFDFVHPVIEMKPNHECNKVQSTTNARSKANDHAHSPNASPRRSYDNDEKLAGTKSAIARHLRIREFLTWSMCKIRSRKTSKESREVPEVPGQDQWLGLTRYLDDENNIALEHERWKSVEYGEHAIIVDSPNIAMSLHWDVPGLVGEPLPTEDGLTHTCDINGDTPPEWAIELRVNEGIISYGPWADRLRQELQPMFFPTTYKDATPTKPLSPGQTRMSTIFKLNIDIEQTTTLMIPTREPSKDWKWKDDSGAQRRASKDGGAGKGFRKKKAREKANALPAGRPYGWLAVELQPDSTITFTMDLIARPDGYRNLLDLDIRGPRMSSSVNHGLLLSAGKALISCDLSNPLSWNAIRQWTVNVDCSGLELFLLRDHIFLLTDLISDWTAGPPGDFHTFVPFIYSMSLGLTDFNLRLNANDSNVINDPASMEENTFVTVWAQNLDASLRIPLTSFRPSRNEISFDVDAQNGGFKLSRPPWNTQHVFVESSDVATMDDLKIDGSYNYFSATSSELTDVLRMNVHGISPKIRLYGFLIRAFMRIKDNYFGDDIHFRTHEEYQEQIATTSTTSSNGNINTQRIKNSNDLDVILSVTAVTSEASLPSYLYSPTESVTLDIPSLGLDLRFTNYYMDLDVAFSPIAIGHASSVLSKGEESVKASETQVFVDGVEVRGHRLFGLPPTEPTYVCNWDFVVGGTSGECSILFLKAFSSALQCFSFTFDDAENALQPLSLPQIHDVMFLRAHIKSLRIWVEVDNAALLVTTRDCKIEFNDWSKSLFSRRLRIDIPTIAMAIVDTNGTISDRRYQQPHLRPCLYIESALELSVLNRGHNFDGDRRLQQQHIILHDSRTGRVPWLIGEDEKGPGPFLASSRDSKAIAPAMPVPAMPEPMQISKVSAFATESASELSQTSATSATSTADKGSFRTRSSCKRTSAFEAQKVRERHDPNISSYHTKPRASWGSIDTPFPSSQSQPSEVHNREKRQPHGKANKTFGASSSYKVPYFRLQNASLDLSEVPDLPDKSAPASSEESSKRASTVTDVEELPLGQNSCERLACFVDLGKGIRALCKPESLEVLTSLFEQLQIQEPVSLLDKLQIDALGSLPNTEKEPDECETITEARISIPCLRLNITEDARGLSGATALNLFCDLGLDGCTATLRRSNKFSLGMKIQSNSMLSAHVALDQARLSVRVFNPQSQQDHTNLQLGLQDSNIWGCKAAESRAHVQFKDLHTELEVHKPDFLPFLIQRGDSLGQNAQRFRDTTLRRIERARQIVLSLAVEGRDISDPPFLTRASYVLRIANSHLRTSGSWKIVSRLRYIYQSLSPHSRAQIESQCSEPSESCPDSAREDVVSIFRRLGTWDGDEVRESILLNGVFGKVVNQDTKTGAGWRLKVSIRAGAVLVILQPGRTQSRMHFETIVFDSMLRWGLSSGVDPSTVEMLVSTQLCYSSMTLTLNFCLLELLQDIFLVFAGVSDDKVTSPQEPGPNKVLANSYRIHSVMRSDVNTLVLDSMSLRVLYLCRPLSSSLLFAKTTEQSRMSTNFLICADLATIEVLSHSQIVTVGKVDRPSIFGNLDGEQTDAAPNNWHLAASCTDVSLKVLADILSLFEVADRVLLNEVASIQRMLSTLSTTLDDSRPQPAPSTDVALGRPHVALFFDSYLISYKVLSALSYRVTGRIGRISLRPGSRHASAVILDFDLKEHAHAFLGRVDTNFEMVSELVIPPINGRLNVGISPSQKDVSFQSTIEHISMDAAAVHALLATLNHPEIAELASSIQHESARLIQRYKPTAQPRKSAPASAPAPKPIVFDANITLVGLGIHTRTTKDPKKNTVSQLHFELGHIHFKGNNRGMSDRRALNFPELLVYLRGLQMGFTRSTEGQERPCGDFTLSVTLQATSNPNDRHELVRAYQVRSSRCETTLYTETASVIIDVLDDLRESFRDIDMTNEVKGLQKLRRATLADIGARRPSQPAQNNEGQSTALFNAMYSLELKGLRVAWRIGDSIPLSPGRVAEDLVLSFTKIDLATRRDNAARLLIQDFQLQMVPTSQLPQERSHNSALLPEVVFNVAYMSSATDRRLAFQAAGKSLDLRLTSQFILPASNLRRSIALAVNDVRAATRAAGVSSAQAGSQTQNWFKHKRLGSLLIDADFAGAVVYIQGRTILDSQSSALDVLQGRRVPQQGRYGQFTDSNTSSNTTLRAPGVAFKVEYKDLAATETSLNAEVKVDASSNILYPSVVPLVLEMSSSVKEMVGEPVTQAQTADHRPSSTSRMVSDERIRTADPSAIFGNCTLNLGLRICRQDFSLSCQPIARVAATAQIDSIYVTANTVRPSDHGQSFALSGTFSGLQASVQHVYSRESTGGLEVQSVSISLMNSKHLGAPNGVSVITQISPTKVYVNVKQLQDFLLFREIWLPADIRKPAPAPAPAQSPSSSESQAYIVQRYQQIAATGAFPWDATLSVGKLDFQIDFGQSLGKMGLIVSDMWISSKKSSNWEQNLCLGVGRLSLDSTGRMSGFVTVGGITVRTTIRWSMAEKSTAQAPLIQASVGLESMQVKAAFEYQPFAMADMAGFKFLMYNVRDGRISHSDRLVGVANIGALRAFCTTTSVAQGLALYQAFERLIQEKQTAYKASLKEMEKSLRRRSTVRPQTAKTAARHAENSGNETTKGSLRLQTKVMVTISTMNVGVFPSTFFDTQVFKVEALDASAQFAVALEEGKLHSMLSLALGQLQVGLSAVSKPEARKSVGEASLEDVIPSASHARGGTILKVPKVVATMQTWQSPASNDIEFIFKSAFQGKVDVGWNYSRIAYLRGMWNNHVRALAARLGKPLPQSALQITTALDEDDKSDGRDASPAKEKITAVVNMPQSKYRYTPLEPPVIETPQLRDMGEATPPLEWIGLQRERLPHLTHQIVIVSLLGVAREVDDAYSRILGSS